MQQEATSFTFFKERQQTVEAMNLHLSRAGGAASLVVYTSLKVERRRILELIAKMEIPAAYLIPCSTPKLRKLPQMQGFV